MKLWDRAYPNEACGYCGIHQPAETAVLVIWLPRLAHPRRIRCQACAGEPPDLAALAAADDMRAVAAAERRMVLAVLAAQSLPPEQPRDVKLWAAGEREEEA